MEVDYISDKMRRKSEGRLFLLLLSAVTGAAVCAALIYWVSSLEDVANCVRALVEIRRQLFDWPFVYPDLDPMNDPAIISHVFRFVLEPPSGEDYNLQRPDRRDASEGEHTSKRVVPEFFAGMRDGVFFEAGALDGETVSTTLYLEKELGWSGMLVEMTPLNHDIIRSKHRKSTFAPVCLSPKPWPLRISMIMEYDPQDILTRWGATIVNEQKSLINQNADPRKKTYSTTVACYPLQTLLLAANMTRINFLSLDLEGAELQVLRTLQWEKFQIDVIHMDLIHTVEGFEATRKFLVSQGYVHVSGTSEPVLFAREGYVSPQHGSGQKNYY